MRVGLGEIGLAVKRLQARHHREANQRLAALDLSLAQWDMLRHLHGRPSASLHDLALLTFQTDQSAGALATRMIQRGLLERVDTPGRAVRHRITDAGERVRSAGAVIVDGVLAETIGRLTPDEQTALHALLVKAADPEPVADGGRTVTSG